MPPVQILKDNNVITLFFNYSCTDFNKIMADLPVSCLY